VVFPELSLTGYELDAAVVSVEDPRLGPIVEACAETRSVALVGAPVDEEAGQSPIGMLAVDGTGATVAYHKMWLGTAESNRFSPGSKPAVLEVDGWRLGLAICKDIGILSTPPIPPPGDRRLPGRHPRVGSRHSPPRCPRPSRRHRPPSLGRGGQLRRVNRRRLHPGRRPLQHLDRRRRHAGSGRIPGRRHRTRDAQLTTRANHQHTPKTSGTSPGSARPARLAALQVLTGS
jgi:hypothetical protein